MTDLRALAVIAVLALSGCAGSSLFDERVGFVDVFSGYSRSGFSAFAAAGPSVEMHGPLPGGADAATVAAALRLPANFPQTPFQAIEPGSAPRGQRIVLAFGVFGALNLDDACRGEVPGAGADSLQVSAVYCVGRRPASTASLRHDRALTPDDPAFTAAMRRLFAAMAPLDDARERRGGSRCILAPC